MEKNEKKELKDIEAREKEIHDKELSRNGLKPESSSRDS